MPVKCAGAPGALFTACKACAMHACIRRMRYYSLVLLCCAVLHAGTITLDATASGWYEDNPSLLNTPPTQTNACTGCLQNYAAGWSNNNNGAAEFRNFFLFTIPSNLTITAA